MYTNQQQEKRIYCISGLAADARLFEFVHVPGYQLVHIAWPVPQKDESLVSYAHKMMDQVQDEQPILMGVSFGGMLAIELAKKVAAKQTIIISSVQNCKDLPVIYRMGKRHLTVNLIPNPLITKPNKVVNFLFGAETTEDKQLLNSYLLHANPAYVKWALWCILNWKNDNLPQNVHHIHGSKDRVIPLPKNAHTVVKGGGHLMIHNRAAEINEILSNLLK